MLCSKWKGSTIFHLLYHPCRMYIHRIQISASSSCSYQSNTLHWISMPLSCCGVRDGNALNKFLREERSPPLFIPLSVLCEMLSYLSWTVSEHIRFLFFFFYRRMLLAHWGTEGDGYLLGSPGSRSPHYHLMMFTSGHLEGQVRCWSSLWWSQQLFWIQAAVCVQGVILDCESLSSIIH